MSLQRLEPGDFNWSTGAGRADEVRAIAAAAHHHDGVAALNEAAQLRLAHQGLETGLLLLAPDAGGFSYVHGLSGATRPEVDLVVHPDSRRQGLGTQLMSATLGALGGIPLTAWSHGHHPGAARLAAHFGLTPERELLLLARPAASTGPAAVESNPSAIRTFEVGRDEEAVLRVNAAAFADHPEQGGLDLTGLRQRFDERWYDPAGFFVGELLDGSVAGFHWTKINPDEPAVGEVYVLGVLPAAQGTGLGRQLLARGLRHLHGRGVAEVVLYVEADNVAALALYRKAGFTTKNTDVLYRTPA